MTRSQLRTVIKAKDVLKWKMCEDGKIFTTYINNKLLRCPKKPSTNQYEYLLNDERNDQRNKETFLRKIHMAK